VTNRLRASMQVARGCTGWHTKDTIEIVLIYNASRMSGTNSRTE
jgi:hypothetical protein